MSRYPEIRAGQRITGKMLTDMQFQEVVKDSATSRANFPTMTDDPDLRFELEGNAVYFIEFFVNYITTDTPGFKTAWTVPVGSSGLRRVEGLGPGVHEANAIGDTRMGVHAFSTQVTWGNRTGGTQAFIAETGTVYTDAAGTVALAWCQNSSNASATEVSATSYARCKRIQ